MATPLKELGQSLRELDKCMAPIHSRSPGDESASRQKSFDEAPRQPTEVAPTANAPLLLAAAVPCLRNVSGQAARVAELAAAGWEAEALEQIGRARAVLRRAAGWEAEATATATAASATQLATGPVSVVTATVAERGVDVNTSAAVNIGIGSPQPPGGSRRAAGERARAAGERARAAAEEARSARALADEAALSAAGWAAAAELAEARAAEAAVEEAEAAAEEEAAAAEEEDAEARASAEIAQAVALAAAGRSPRPATDPDEGSGRYTPDGGDRYAGDDTTLWEAPWSRSRGAAAAGTSAGVAAIEAEAQAATAAAAAALEASNQQLVVAELQMQVRRQEETLGRLRADEARRAAAFGATTPPHHHHSNSSSSDNDLPADAQPLSPTRRAMAAVQGAGAALARSTSKLLADFGSTPTSPSRTAAAAADAASFNPTPDDGWVHNAGPEGGYVRSPVTACGGGFGGDGGGAEEIGIAAGAVLSAEHGHFALAALSAEAPSTEPRTDRPLHGQRPQANGRAPSPTPSHRAVSAVDGSVHAAVAGGSVEAWLGKASEMQISRRRSFGADGEPLSA